MAGSTTGRLFCVTTWGESHGTALGVTVDGCPAGLSISAEDIQKELDKRRPGNGAASTKRKEMDRVQILSGIFEGKTLGTPITLAVFNEDQHSKDYDALKNIYRPGHADFGFDSKFGFRDHRGGGRSSGRETLARVAAGAIAKKMLEELGIQFTTYTAALGPFRYTNFDANAIEQNVFRLPDLSICEDVENYLKQLATDGDSCGGIIECRIQGVPAGIGDPVFGKLDALLSSALMSIGAVKGVEIGDGFAAASALGSANNDGFHTEDGITRPLTNHAGGIMGGFSNGGEIIARIAVKPTPSIRKEQDTATADGQNTTISIGGRHDVCIVPRAVPVAEAMCAITLADAVLCNMGARMDKIKHFYE